MTRKSTRLFLVHLKVFVGLAMVHLGSGECRAQMESMQTMFAQNATSSDGISVTASESVNVVPNRLRLVTSMKCQDTDSIKAVKRLQIHAEKIRAELVSMKADESSIRFSETNLEIREENGSTNMVAAFAMAAPMPAARFPAPGDDEEAKMPEIYVASSFVTADWKLPEAKPEILGPSRFKLIKEATVRDFMGSKLTATFSPEQQDLMEDIKRRGGGMQPAQQVIYSGLPAANTSKDPHVYYVGSVLPNDLSAASKRAFANAEKKGRILAEASGRKLGRVLSLHSSLLASNPASPMTNYYPNQTMEEKWDAKTNDGEIADESLRGLTRNLVVSVRFSIE